jgi:hypothetical protein
MGIDRHYFIPGTQFPRTCVKCGKFPTDAMHIEYDESDLERDYEDDSSRKNVEDSPTVAKVQLPALGIHIFRRT